MINFKAVDYLLYLLIRDKMRACGNGFIQNIYTIQIIECLFSLYSMSTICNSYVFENKKVSLQVSMENV